MGGAIAIGVVARVNHASAEGGGGYTGGVACPAQQGWTGTQANVQTYTVEGTVSQAPCPLPNVHGSAGSTSYNAPAPPPNPPPDGTACHEYINANVMMSRLSDGSWRVQYYDPNDNQVVSAT
ncbi:MAG: hypothetical protein ACREQ5_36705, partial [Candidatus Dormibacteria bacterium]